MLATGNVGITFLLCVILEVVLTDPVYQSCLHYSQYTHSVLSKNVTIDLDGSGGPSPEFTAYCNVSVTPPNMVIGHDLYGVLDLDGPANFIHDLSYAGGMPWTVIDSVVQRADMCQQFVSLQCYKAEIYNDKGTQVTAWYSRSGVKMSSWVGGPPNKGCACKLNNSCDASPERTEICNCDKETGEWLEDSAWLTKNDPLPVRRVDIGDIDGADEFGKLEIGPLVCSHSLSMTEMETSFKVIKGHASLTSALQTYHGTSKFQCISKCIQRLECIAASYQSVEKICVLVEDIVTRPASLWNVYVIQGRQYK